MLTRETEGVRQQSYTEERNRGILLVQAALPGKRQNVVLRAAGSQRKRPKKECSVTTEETYGMRTICFDNSGDSRFKAIQMHTHFSTSKLTIIRSTLACLLITPLRRHRYVGVWTRRETRSPCS